MKEKMLSWSTLMCLAVLTCLLLVHTLAIFPGVDAMRWFFRTSAVVLGRLDAPAWIQAIFSIVAILAAIGIAMWQRRSDGAAARRTARATVMVVGAAVDSKVFMLIATVTAVLDEHFHPSRPTAVERGRFVQTLFAKAEVPTEEQLLLVASAMPNAAWNMANGVAAVKRVLVSLDFVVSAPTLTTLSEKDILANYLGTRNNLLTALRCLREARAEMHKYAAGI